MTAIIDIETDNTDPQKANLKYFGGLDCESGEITLIEHTDKEAISKYIQKHNILIGFNIKNYDRVILERFGVDFKYKIVVDLWEALAPKGDLGGKMNIEDRFDARVRIANERLKRNPRLRDCWDESISYCKFYGNEHCKYTCGYALKRKRDERKENL